MRDYLEIGPSPAEENAAQMGASGFEEANRDECKRFVELIRKVCGEPPEGARLTVRSNSHDFGCYREVAVSFDDENADAVDYAIHVENHSPTRWDGSGGRKWGMKPVSVLAEYMD